MTTATGTLTYEFCTRPDGKHYVRFYAASGKLVGQVLVSHEDFAARRLGHADSHVWVNYYDWRQFALSDRLAALSVARDECIDRGLIRE